MKYFDGNFSWGLTSEDFRILSKLNEKLNTQFLRATSDLSDNTFEWFIINHEDFIFRKSEYYVSFEGEFVEEITCREIDQSGAIIDAKSIRIESALGTFYDPVSHKNGIFDFQSATIENAV